MVTKLPVYPVDHPVALAIHGFIAALRSGVGIFDALTNQAAEAGVPFGSEPFDDAAALVGFPYCRNLDLYVDRETKCRADALPFSEAHLAFLH